MKTLILLIFLMLPTWVFSQQIADTSYNPIIQNPEYDAGKGSVVFIDEGHHNFHTMNGRYKAFSNLLERDGYSVIEYKGEFKKNELAKGKILVVSNALNEINVDDWYLPNPSAFTTDEIEIVKKWVYDGGSLFLIADHMPMAGAAKDLAAEFEFEFTNGIAQVQGVTFSLLINNQLARAPGELHKPFFYNDTPEDPHSHQVPIQALSPLT